PANGTLRVLDTIGAVLNHVTANMALSSTNELSYLPGTNFNGLDSFSFRTDDGMLTSSNVSIFLTAVAVNDVPIAYGQSLTNAEDTVLPITLTGFDNDGPATNFAIVGFPTNGTLLGFDATNGSVNYLPNSDFYGSDTLTFVVTDGALTSAVATIF